MERRKFFGLSAAVLAVAAAPVTSLNAVNFRETNKGVWESEKTASAIKELFGSGGLKKTNKIKFDAPKLAENGGSIPIGLSSKLDIETIALFQDANPRAATVVFSVPEGQKVDYDFRIKMRQTAMVTIVAKTRSGELLTTTKEIDVSIGGCGG